MDRKYFLASLVLMTMFGVACKRQVPVAPEAPVATSSPEVDMPAPAPEVAPTQAVIDPHPAFSSKAFAGTFKGTLPCADCPGIDETLVLKADGSFAMTDIYKDRPHGTQKIVGSWNAEDNGKRIRLDPNTKSQEDRVFAIDSNDRISLLGTDGKPTPGHITILTRQ